MLNVVLGFVALADAVVINGVKVTNSWTVVKKSNQLALEIAVVSDGVIELIKFNSQDLMKTRFNDVTLQFELTSQEGTYVTLDFCNTQQLGKANDWLRKIVTKKQYAKLSAEDNLELAGLIEELIA